MLRWLTSNLPKSVFCSLNFTEPCLMWLEEEAVHVGQLHLIIVKQQQLQGKKSQTQQKEAWQSVTAEPKHVSGVYAIGFPPVLRLATHTTRIRGLKNGPNWCIFTFDLYILYIHTKEWGKRCITLPMPHLVSISAVTLPTPPTPTTATAYERIFWKWQQVDSGHLNWNNQLTL